MTRKYLDVLKDSLEKKEEILRMLSYKNAEQMSLLKEEEFLPEKIEKTVEEKSALIEKLLKLDEGFQTLYDKVKEEINGKKEIYKDQIRQLQDLIVKITDMSVAVQAEEARNKRLFDAKIKKERQVVRLGRNQSNVSKNYYKNMNRTNIMEPQFLDSKK